MRFGAELNQVSARHDINAITGALMVPSPYTLLRVTAGWDVRKGLELYARIENLLNDKYEEPEGFKPPSIQGFVRRQGPLLSGRERNCQCPPYARSGSASA